MEDKKLKKQLKKIPDADKNGDPIYKIDANQPANKKPAQKLVEKEGKKR